MTTEISRDEVATRLFVATMAELARSNDDGDNRRIEIPPPDLIARMAIGSADVFVAALRSAGGGPGARAAG